MRAFVIAEAGANHNRDWGMATKLIDAAVKAKADAVKFQTYSSETLYAKNTPDFAGYKNINKLIKDIELPRHWQKDLKKYCDDCGIEFMSTPFDEKAVDELYDLGVSRFKIAGFESTDPRFVKYVSSSGLPLIISLGIGSNIETVNDIHYAILRDRKIDLCEVELQSDSFFEKFYKENCPIRIGELNKTMPDITYLHCNNAYPTPYEDINLGSLEELKNFIEFNRHFCNSRVGLSDHTEGILIPPIAVAMGAKVIEKHFTLDRGLSGPDHSFAIEPDELSEMVKNIRVAEKAMGTKESKYTNSERNFKSATRSVVSIRKIKAGEFLTEENVSTKRPFSKGNVPAADFFNVLGRSSLVDVDPDTPLKSNCVMEELNEAYLQDRHGY